MITTLLKQKYQEATASSKPGPWIKAKFDSNNFIAEAATEFNTTPETISKLLKTCDWFKNES